MVVPRYASRMYERRQEAEEFWDYRFKTIRVLAGGGALLGFMMGIWGGLEMAFGYTAGGALLGASCGWYIGGWLGLAAFHHEDKSRATTLGEEE